MMNDSRILYATLPRRIKASIVDSVVLLTLMIISPVVIGLWIPRGTGLSGAAMFAPPLFLEPLLISYLGFTLGQYLFGIRVVRIDGGGHCPLAPSFLRYLTKTVLGGVSVAYMLFSRKHQAIHDHVASTLVVLSAAKIEKQPGFARHGELEQDLGGEYIYPSPLRRFMLFLVWLMPASVLLGMTIVCTALFVVPGYTVTTEKLPKAFEIAGNFAGSILFISMAVLASKGYLPGARRKRTVAEDTGGHGGDEI